MDPNIVSIHDLGIDFETIDGRLSILLGVSLQIGPGEVVGVVGETGCGKSVMAKTLLGILPMPPAHIRQGNIHFMGHDLRKINPADREALKLHVAYIPQDPTASLNPVFSVGDLMVDMIIWNESGRRLSRYLWMRQRKRVREMAEQAASGLLEKVHIPDPRSILGRYPVELSGGMKQRVLLAMALCGTPKLLVADEPTTALDATIQKRILSLIQEKIDEGKMSGLYVTHNLGVARIICSRTYVMYAGTIVESGETPELLDRPLHPYTEGLIRSIPRLTGAPFHGIEGQVPDYLNPPQGCRFQPRCKKEREICSREVPTLVKAEKSRGVACWLYHG